MIPDGTITGAHFIKTPDFVQVTGKSAFLTRASCLIKSFSSGVGNLTFLNIPKGDAGGELDPHGADGNGM